MRGADVFTPPLLTESLVSQGFGKEDIIQMPRMLSKADKKFNLILVLVTTTGPPSYMWPRTALGPTTTVSVRLTLTKWRAVSAQ